MKHYIKKIKAYLNLRLYNFLQDLHTYENGILTEIEDLSNILPHA